MLFNGKRRDKQVLNLIHFVFQSNLINEISEHVKIIRSAVFADQDDDSLKALDTLVVGMSISTELRELYALIFGGQKNPKKSVERLIQFFTVWEISDRGVHTNENIIEFLRDFKKRLDVDPEAVISPALTLQFLESISEILADMGYKTAAKGSRLMKLLHSGCYLLEVHTSWGYFKELAVPGTKSL